MHPTKPLKKILLNGLRVDLRIHRGSFNFLLCFRLPKRKKRKKRKLLVVRELEVDLADVEGGSGSGPEGSIGSSVDGRSWPRR
jgi:hypothetical protein